MQILFKFENYLTKLIKVRKIPHFLYLILLP